MNYKILLLVLVAAVSLRSVASEKCIQNLAAQRTSVVLILGDYPEYIVTVYKGGRDFTAWYQQTAPASADIANIGQTYLKKTADLSSDSSVLPDDLTLSTAIGILTNYRILQGAGFFLNNSVSFTDQECGPVIAPPHQGCPNSPRNHCI